MANFNEMMEQYMEMYFAKMMEAKMNEMFSSMMPQEPQVAKAEVVEAPVVNRPMTREEYLAKYPQREKTVKEVDLSELNWVAISEKKVTFNSKNIPNDVWCINFLTVKKFNGSYHKDGNSHWFTFKSTADCRNFMMNAPIIKTLSKEDYNKIIAYREEQMKSDRVSEYQRSKIQKVIDEWTAKRDALK